MGNTGFKVSSVFFILYIYGVQEGERLIKREFDTR